MARRPMALGERERRELELEAARVDEWAKRKHPPKKSSSWDRDEARRQVADMMDQADWSTARPKHLVELYAHLHERVYGVVALELQPARARMSAAALAARALKEHFGGDVRALVEFVRWTWRRQAAEEKARRAGLRESEFRVTWRYQWSPRLVTDYRRAEASGHA